MRITVSARYRDRLVRVLRMEPRQDGFVDTTMLRLDPGQESAVVHQVLSKGEKGMAVLADGAPAFDARGVSDLPEGFWPARRTAGGWIALIDEPSPFAPKPFAPIPAVMDTRSATAA